MRYFLIYIVLVLISLLNFDFYTPTDNPQINNQIVKKHEEEQTKDGAAVEPLVKETYLVTRVIDGDTIVVQMNGTEKTLRYIGIDTPETVQPSGIIECFGQEASDRNRELVLGKMVKLVRDVSDTDRYGRLLRYVYIDDKLINLSLVQDGYANANSYSPDTKYDKVLKLAEQTAKINGAGLWGSTCTPTL